MKNIVKTLGIIIGLCSLWIQNGYGITISPPTSKILFINNTSHQLQITVSGNMMIAISGLNKFQINKQESREFSILATGILHQPSILGGDTHFGGACITSIRIETEGKNPLLKDFTPPLCPAANENYKFTIQFNEQGKLSVSSEKY